MFNSSLSQTWIANAIMRADQPKFKLRNQSNTGLRDEFPDQ
jgi:hypothetical protein